MSLYYVYVCACVCARYGRQVLHRKVNEEMFEASPSSLRLYSAASSLLARPGYAKAILN